jgi:hypothetical protein
MNAGKNTLIPIVRRLLLSSFIIFAYFFTYAQNQDMKKDMVLTRVFDASVEQVWKAWSESEQVMRWWGPTGFTCPLAKMNFHEGGKFAGMYACP